jgi:hypothetical protein
LLAPQWLAHQKSDKLQEITDQMEKSENETIMVGLGSERPFQ